MWRINAVMGLLALGMFVTSVLYTARAQDEGQPQAPVAPVLPGEPQWITVWRVPMQESRDGKPFIDLRCVVYAKNEATAIMRSIMYFKDIYPDWILRSLDFIEAAPRKPDTQDRK